MKKNIRPCVNAYNLWGGYIYRNTTANLRSYMYIAVLNSVYTTVQVQCTEVCSRNTLNIEQL